MHVKANEKLPWGFGGVDTVCVICSSFIMFYTSVATVGVIQ